MSSSHRDIRKYPNAASAKGRIEVIQEQGETIFVPSCWHHQVWNLVRKFIILWTELSDKLSHLFGKETLEYFIDKHPGYFHDQKAVL